MAMEAGADTQQSGETAVSESEAQQITLAQVIHAVVTKFTHSRASCELVIVSQDCSQMFLTHELRVVMAAVHSSRPGVIQ